MSLPSKFEFCTKYARATHYTLSLDSTTGKYICTASSLEDAYDLPATYSVEFVKAAIDCGNWIVTKNLDEVAVEREMVFPFYFVHSDARLSKPNNHNKVVAGSKKGHIRVIWDECTEGSNVSRDNFWTVEQARSFIERGIWIVKAVGEKAEEINVEETLKEFGIVAGDAGEYTFTGTMLSGLAAIPQPRESVTISTLKVVVECDTTEALANAKALAAAYEQLAISVESVIALTKEMKSV